MHAFWAIFNPGTEGTLVRGVLPVTPTPYQTMDFCASFSLSGPGLLSKCFSAFMGKSMVPTESLSLKNNLLKIIFQRVLFGVQTLLPFWYQIVGQKDLSFSWLLAESHSFSPCGPGLRLFVPRIAANLPGGSCPREEREATVPCGPMSKATHCPICFTPAESRY